MTCYLASAVALALASALASACTRVSSAATALAFASASVLAFALLIINCIGLSPSLLDKLLDSPTAFAAFQNLTHLGRGRH